MSESASKGAVDPMNRGYMQNLKRIQSKRLEQEALLQRDPIEARSVGRGHWASSTDQSENAGKRSFGPVRPLSAPRGTYNPSASASSSGTVFRGRSRSPSVSEGRSRSGSRSHSRGRSNSVGSSDSRMSTFKRDLQISRALAAEEQQRSEYLNTKKKAYLDRLTKPWMPSGKGNAESSSNIVKQAIAKVDKYAQQKAWRKAPWPDYVPPEARQSSGSVSGSRESSRPSTPVRRDRTFAEHDAPSHMDVHEEGHIHHHDRPSNTRELSPPRSRSRANSHDSRNGGSYKASAVPSTWETKFRVHEFILGPPPIAPGNSAAVVDDSVTTITQLSMGTGAYTLSHHKRKVASNPPLSKMLPVPIRIVNHESEWVNQGAYFTAFAQGDEGEQLDENHELFEQQLQGKRPIVSSSSAGGKSQRSDNVSKRDTDTVFPTKRLPLAEPLARFGQTGGAVTYGTLNIRRNCSLAEVFAAARQQFDLEDISDVTLVKNQRYSRETVSYSMSMRTLTDPPPIDDDCTLVFYLGGTLAEAQTIRDGAAALLAHEENVDPHGAPIASSSSGSPPPASLTATRRAVAAAAAAMSYPSSSRRTRRRSPSKSSHQSSSPSRGRREGGTAAMMAMDNRRFVETMEEEAQAYNDFVNATAATFATSALSSSRRPSSSHLHDLLDASSAAEQPQQWQSVRNVHDLQRRHRFSEPTHQHPVNVETHTSTSFRWSDPRDDLPPQPSLSQPSQSQPSRGHHSQRRPHYDYDPVAEEEDDHSAHGFQDARLASTYDAWDRHHHRPSTMTTTMRSNEYPPMPYAFQNPYEAEPSPRGADSQRNQRHEHYEKVDDEDDERALYSEWASGGGAHHNNVSALTLPRFPSYVTAYESEPAVSPSSSSAMRPKISEFDFLAVAKPSSASAAAAATAASSAPASSAPMVAVEAQPSSIAGRPARETPSVSAGAITIDATDAVVSVAPSGDGRMTTTELDGDVPATTTTITANANAQPSSNEEKTQHEEPSREHSSTATAPSIRAPLEVHGDDASDNDGAAAHDAAAATKAKGSWVEPELARLERQYLKSLHLKPSSLRAKSNSAVALAATPMVHVTPTKTRPPPPPLSPSTTRSWTNHRLRPSAATTTAAAATAAGDAVSTTSGGTRSRSTTPTSGRHHRDFQHPPAKETPLSPSMARSESAHRQRMALLREKQAAHVDPYDKKAKLAAKQLQQQQQQQQQHAAESSVESKTNAAAGRVDEHVHRPQDDHDRQQQQGSAYDDYGDDYGRGSGGHIAGSSPADRRYGGGRSEEEDRDHSNDNDNDNGDDEDYVTARLNSGDSAFAGYRQHAAASAASAASAAPYTSSPSQQQQYHQRQQQASSAADDESSVASYVTMNSHGTTTSRSSNVREMFLDFRDMARKTTLH